MAQHSAQLDDVFHALADPTRRAVLGRLGTGPASVGELAAPFAMALPSFMKHIRYLEDTGVDQDAQDRPRADVRAGERRH